MLSSEKSLLDILFFFYIMVADHGTSDYDIRKEIKILIKLLNWFSAIVFNTTHK